MAASSSFFSAPTFSPAIQRHHPGHLSPSNISFQGLRPLTRLGARTKSSTSTPKRSTGAVVKAELLNPSLVISLSTGLSLFLGRFVFFNFQRENVAKQGLPEQNGMTHFEAGDTRAKEYVSLLKSNDPVGFNIVDVLAWGSIGHIVAYYILATSSNGYDPKFFD
ncbi:Photosystem I reaction center subunit V, chloroplastic [Morella rubra]|uniref:Photosystem I reaction center subunit V, chloroplastic n=1 Tax=Morella rubra TaxID=262757 RepID=A0A6A1VQ04_9ROSI|nr:Photosystem I reaction center subunit V, chloroplastic [Morella rubra]